MKFYKTTICEPQDYSEEAIKNYEKIGRVNQAVNELSTIPENTEILVIRLRKVDKELLDSLSYLQVIASPTTGLDHIDLAECKRRKIEIISLRGETEFLKTIPATAEHTMALMFSLMRRIPWAYDDVKGGFWDRENWKGQELKDKILLVIGSGGRIGSMVDQYARAFGMEVIRNNRKNKEELKRMLKEADIVSIHIPLEGNEGYFDRSCFDAMKKTAYLINISRGGIIDEAALLDALLEKRIAGAALDVVQGEPKVSNDLIDYALDNDNLLITPHLGGCTYESMEKTEIRIAEKVVEYFKNKSITNGKN